MNVGSAARLACVAALALMLAAACSDKKKDKQDEIAKAKAEAAKLLAKLKGGGGGGGSYPPHKPRPETLVQTKRYRKPIGVLSVKYSAGKARVRFSCLERCLARLGKGAPSLHRYDMNKRAPDGGYKLFRYLYMGSFTFNTTLLDAGPTTFNVILYKGNKQKTVKVTLYGGDFVNIAKGKYWPEIKCHGKNTCSGRYSIGSFKFKAAPGTTLTVGKSTGKTDAKGKLELKLDFTAYVNKPFAELKTLSLPVKVVFAGGATLKGVFAASDLEPMKRVRSWLYKGLKKGVLVPGEKPREGKPRTMYAWGVGFLGDPKSAADIDLLADSKDTKRRRLCGRFRGVRTGRVVRYYVKAEVSRWVVKDRRTGRRIARKTFRARYPRCPRRITSGQSSDVNYVSSSKVKRWLKKFIGG